MARKCRQAPGAGLRPAEHRFDAAGNRVVLVDARALDARPEAVAARWMEESGVAGYDILAVLSGRGAARADFWNPDGSREPFCGNALRCASRVLTGAVSGEVSVETPFVRCTSGHSPGGWGRVRIPAAAVRVGADGEDFTVEVGTPHRVRILAELLDERPQALGRAWSAAADPGARVNATFVQRLGRVARVRTFERGVGETGSCGSGAIAAAAVLAFRRGAVDWSACTRRTLVFRSGNRLSVRHDAAAGTLTLSGRFRYLGRAPLPFLA